MKALRFLGILFIFAVGTSTSFAVEWFTDFAAAQEKAAQENKAIFLFFTGSDWCPYCMMADKQWFSTDEFSRVAEKYLVCVLLDFPRDKSKQSDSLKAQNDALNRAYKVEGFPTIILLRSDGTHPERFGFTGIPVEDFCSQILRAIAKAKLAK